jgi:AhpD family alkylhydroperoxidase
MNGFRKRTWRSVPDLVVALGSVVSEPRRAAALLSGERVDAKFRERLMLAVTGVNDCRYCAAVHSSLGALSGLSRDEIASVLAGNLDAVPESQAPALSFAVRWAHRDGAPDAKERRALVEAYGEETAAEIELSLRMIRIGNLTGNSVDAVLHRLGLIPSGA